MCMKLYIPSCLVLHVNKSCGMLIPLLQGRSVNTNEGTRNRLWHRSSMAIRAAKGLLTETTFISKKNEGYICDWILENTP